MKTKSYENEEQQQKNQDTGPKERG